MRAAVLSMVPSDAYKLLGVLVAIWQTRFVLAVMILHRFFITCMWLCVCVYIDVYIIFFFCSLILNVAMCAKVFF